jgi:hypothetical protein
LRGIDVHVELNQVAPVVVGDVGLQYRSGLSRRGDRGASEQYN